MNKTYRKGARVRYYQQFTEKVYSIDIVKDPRIAILYKDFIIKETYDKDYDMWLELKDGSIAVSNYIEKVVKIGNNKYKLYVDIITYILEFI